MLEAAFDAEPGWRLETARRHGQDFGAIAVMIFAELDEAANGADGRRGICQR